MSERGSLTKTSAVPGLAILGCLVTGILGVVLCFCAATEEPLYLVASALAFGILLHVSFKD